METQEAVVVKKAVRETRPNGAAGTEEITALKSQVMSAFGELSRVQAELSERFNLFGKRQVELDQRQAALEKACAEHEARVVVVDRRELRAEARDKALCKREEAVDRREQAARSFQELQARMAAALDDPTPTKLAEAMEAATVSIKDGHAADRARALAEEAVAQAERADQVGGQDAGGTVGAQPANDPDVDVSDFTKEELRKLGMLQRLGTVSTQEIAEQIRLERGGSGQKKKGWFS